MRALSSLLVAACVAACAAPNPRRADGMDAQPAREPAPVVPAAQPAVASAVSAPAPAPAAQPAPAAAPAADDAPAAEPVVAVVAGRPVYVSELLSQWVYAKNFEVLKHLDNLALARIVQVEAQRLGVEVDPSAATAAYERSVAAIEAEVKKKHPKLGFDSYVDRVMGLDPIRYRERLRDDALRQLLGERVARAWLLGSERSVVRIIVAKDEAADAQVKAGLAAGADFAELARQHSADPSSQDGGRIPPVVRSESPIGRLAFSGETGKVAGPVSEAGRSVYLLVEARPAPLTGPWPTIAAAVEADLKSRPVDELEIAQWRGAMQERYEVDFQPFLRLVGQGGR